MSTSSPRQYLLHLLREEADLIRRAAPSDTRRALIQVAREVDSWTVFQRTTRADDSQSREEMLRQFGLAKIISILTDRSWCEPGLPLEPSRSAASEWANMMWLRAGCLGYLEHLLELNRVALMDLRLEGGSYIFRLREGVDGVEYHDRQDFNWMSSFVSDHHDEHWKTLNNLYREVEPTLKQLVDSWNEYFIQYDADPEVDLLYLQAGYLYSQSLFGQDEFPGSTKFGGIDFGVYRKFAGIMIGQALKHVALCFALMKKRKEIDPLNILTIYKTREDAIEEIVILLDLCTGDAEKILDTVTLTRDAVAAQCKTPGDIVSPTYIEIGDGMLLRPLWGSLLNPFRFMLDQLRMSYRPDWDRGVDKREGVFRRQIYNLFPEDRYIKVDRAVRIYKGKKTLATDIDAVIADRTTGTVGILQLKWQDPFSFSLRARESRKVNFIKESNAWVEKVEGWLARAKTNDVLDRLGLNGIDFPEAPVFRIFVLGRHAAHFSGQGKRYSRMAAWGTWAQIVRLLEENAPAEDRVSALYDLLTKNSPFLREKASIVDHRMAIRGVNIVYEGGVFANVQD